MTIQEIAREAGVSPATVSRVFSHYPGIRNDLKEKVLAISRAHGYHPRFSGRQKNVVIITPYNSDFPVQSCVEMILNSLVRVLPERGFRLEILPLNNLERLESIQFCGAVAIGGELASFPDWTDQFTSPLVIVDRPAPRKRIENIFFVRSDEVQGMTVAMEHLLQSGHRKIGCIIHGTPERGNALVRRTAIEKILKKHGMEPDPFLLAYSGDGTEKYVEIIGKMLRRGADALFCPGGNAGLLSLYAMSLFNRKVPEEISLIASEQSVISPFTVPPLSSISPDYPAMANAVADVLERWLNSEKCPGEIVLPYRLIQRESVDSKGRRYEVLR